MKPEKITREEMQTLLDGLEKARVQGSFLLVHISEVQTLIRFLKSEIAKPRGSQKCPTSKKPKSKIS